MRPIVTAALLAYVAFGQQTYIRTPAEAERAETALVSAADNVQLRTMLITYYYGTAFRKPADAAALLRRREHILWLAQHHPETGILGEPEGTIERAGDRSASAEGYAALEAIWRKQVATDSAPAAALANAGHFFRLTDREFGAALIERARRLEPDERAYSEKLGLLYAEAVLGVTVEYARRSVWKCDPAVARSQFASHARAVLEEAKDVPMLRGAAMKLTTGAVSSRREAALDFDPAELAEKLLLRARGLNPGDDVTLRTLAQHYSLRAQTKRGAAEGIELSRKWLNTLLERAALARDAMHRSPILADMAKAAYQAGDPNAASAYAKELLTMVEKGRRLWNADDAIHRANTILGLVASDLGDIDAAAGLLISSAKMSGSPALSSFGPSMLLAQSLLQKGRTEAVLEYFSLCGAFWRLGKGKLEQWTKQVQAGETPVFGANLVY